MYEQNKLHLSTFIAKMYFIFNCQEFIDVYYATKRPWDVIAMHAGKGVFNSRAREDGG